MKKTLLFVVAALMLMATTALANTFTFQYSGAPYANDFTGSGQLVGNDNGNGTYSILSGFSTVFFNGVDYGTLQLETNPNTPLQATSVSGLWFFDNQLPLNNNGLLFGGLFGGQNVELNIYSPNGQYFLADMAVNGAYTPDTTGRQVDFSAAPVPEPGTMMLLGAGFLGLAICGKRRKNA
jgi:hypothetical protein